MSHWSATSPGDATMATCESGRDLKADGSRIGGRRRGCDSRSTRCRPHACARSATSRPMAPKPIRPSVLPLRPAALANVFLSHVAGAQRCDVVRNAAVEREDEPERQLGDGHGVAARAVRDVDAARGGGRDVDRVVAGAGANHQRQRAGVQHRAR